jgi:hypothetical protein
MRSFLLRCENRWARSQVKPYWTFFTTGSHDANVWSEVMGTTLNQLSNGGIHFTWFHSAAKTLRLGRNTLEFSDLHESTEISHRLLSNKDNSEIQHFIVRRVTQYADLSGLRVKAVWLDLIRTRTDLWTNQVCDSDLSLTEGMTEIRHRMRDTATSAVVFMTNHDSSDSLKTDRSC